MHCILYNDMYERTSALKVSAPWKLHIRVLFVVRMMLSGAVLRVFSIEDYMH